MRPASIVVLLLFVAGISHSAGTDFRDVSLPDAQDSTTLRCYSTERQSARPAIILLHGGRGYSQFLSMYERYVKELMSEGYAVCAALYYSVDDRRVMRSSDRDARRAHYRKKFRTWSSDIASAVDFLATSDTHRHVGLIGFSQGAFLAVAVAGTNSNVKAVAALYGGVPSQASREIAKLPPILILHGDSDIVVPVEEAYTLEEFVGERARSYTIRIYPGAGHGFDADATSVEADDAYRQISRFFGIHLASAEDDG